MVSAPVKLQAEGVKRLVEDALWTRGLRKRLESSKKRHEFQTDHGFRKWFNTRCELAGMKPTHIQILMNHSLGISDSYLRPTEGELLDEYLKAVDFLTINDSHRLQKEVTDISQKAKEANSLINAKLQQRDNDIAELRAAVAFLSDKVNAAIIANEPSSKVISDQNGVPKGIEFASRVGNAKAELTKSDAN